MITPAQVAQALGWPVRRARRRLLATGAGEKRGRRLVTTFPRLVERFPEAAHAFGPCSLPEGAQAVLESADVAKALGVTTRQARRLMLREGFGEKRAGRVITSAHRLLARAEVRASDDDA